MVAWDEKKKLAAEWKAACNLHDVERIMSMYSADVIFKSPRVAIYAGEESGAIHGKAAVRKYWEKVFEANPDLAFNVGNVFFGIDSVALEYKVGNRLHGIEFMILNSDGKVCLAVGNDAPSTS